MLIMENDREQEAIIDKGWEMTKQDWKRLMELKRYRRESLVPGAEQLLKWNTDKGKVG
jgi:hypothetical protein